MVDPMARHAQSEQVSEPREWLIRKGGYYYRPNCAGYTTSKFEAGRYTKAEAEKEAAVEPWHMKAIHQDDVEDDPVSSRVRMDATRIAKLEAENARLKEALAESDRQAEKLEALLDSHVSWDGKPPAGCTAALSRTGAVKVLDPDMPAQEMRLHMGEMTAQEMRTARAAIRWANTRLTTEPAAPVQLSGNSGILPAAPEGRQEADQQEPVAWMWEEVVDPTGDVIRGGTITRFATHWSTPPSYAVVTPLYTRPAEQAVTEVPHAELVSLMAEIASGHLEIDYDGDEPFIRLDSIETAIEAALVRTFAQKEEGR